MASQNRKKIGHFIGCTQGIIFYASIYVCYPPKLHRTNQVNYEIIAMQDYYFVINYKLIIITEQN